VPFLPQTSVLAASWAHPGSPEHQAAFQTPPVNHQGAPLSGVVPAVRHVVRCSACMVCFEFRRKTRVLAVIAGGNYFANLLFLSEVSCRCPCLVAALPCARTRTPPSPIGDMGAATEMSTTEAEAALNSD
jgi:hypothetical protein